MKPPTPPAASNILQLDPAQLPPQDLYALLTGAIVPRPIAWVSTLDTQGRGNLAPFSFFNGVGSEPPTLMFAIARQQDLSKKHTLKNIEATQEFVVNVVSKSQLAAMHQTSANYPEGVNELSAVGLTSLPSHRVRPVRVSGSAVQFECRLERIVDLVDRHPLRPGTSSIVVGEIVWVHIDTSVMEGEFISAPLLQPVARLGGRHYTELGPITTLPPARA